MHYTEQVQREAIVVCSSESGDESSSDLKEILNKSEKMYQHTRICIGTIAPVNYSALARGINVNKEHPAIVKSQASNSSTKKEAFTDMASTLNEMAMRLEEQAEVQREQFCMI